MSGGYTGPCDCGADRCTGWQLNGCHVERREMPKLAPHRPNGDLCHHERGDLKYGEAAVWKPIEPFNATLTYQGYSRGRSAAYFHWKDDATGVTYPMFMSGMDRVMDSGFVEGNRISGRFVAVKQGQNYGLSWLGPIR